MDYKPNLIITIGRQTGSGGREVARLLAERLGVPYYDKELLEKAAEVSGLSRELFVARDEKPTNSFLYSLVMDGYSMGYNNAPGAAMSLDHKIFLAQFEAIKKVAAEGPCVIVGRCADYALDGDPRLLSVFLHADFAFRVKRVASENGISENKARELILKTDKKRSSYYNYYTDKKWGSSFSYDYLAFPLSSLRH